MFLNIYEFCAGTSEYNTIRATFSGEELCKGLQGRLDANLEDYVSKDLGAITPINTLGKLNFETLYFVGLGERKELTTAKLRTVFGELAKMMEKDFVLHAESFATETIPGTTVAQIFVESYILARYVFKKYRADRKESAELTVRIFTADDASAAIEKGIVYGEATNHARDLSNEPSNKLIPADLATYAQQLAKDLNLECEVLANSQLKELGAGALLAVNRGSRHEARMITIKYQGLPTWENPTALVGKGVTFDTGGYSLKPPASMVGMKHDMSGAANVLGAIEAIARLGLKANVMAVIAATENMVSDYAMKVDDVITSLAGKTIEVNNADAEGRLILADAVTYAQQQGATRVVDIATLTGACLVALGTDISGVVSNNDSFYNEFVKAAAVTDEKQWRLPTDQWFVDQVRSSKVADLLNGPTRFGGASIAAAFIGEFIEVKDWIHLDIAGTGNVEKDTALCPYGATGVFVRAMAELFA